MRQFLLIAASFGSLIVIATAGSPLLSAQAILNPPPIVTSPTYVDIPPPQQEIVTTATSPATVWVPGQWERTADSWSWNPGEWIQPPFSNAYWLPGYWQHNNGQFLWTSGHWATADQQVVVEKPVTVPPLYEEVQPPAPATTGWVWQPGYWSWRGTWVWVPGEYIQSVEPNAEWVPGAWEAAAGGKWRWNPAHWQLE